MVLILWKIKNLDLPKIVKVVTIVEGVVATTRIEGNGRNISSIT